MVKSLFIALIISSISAICHSAVCYASHRPDSIITSPDSTDRYARIRFSPKQLILPGTLIAVGAWGVKNGFLVKMKEKVRDGFQNLRGDCRWRGDDYIQYIPMAAFIGLGFLDTSPRHDFRQRITVGLTAYAFMGIMVNSTKRFVNERRPDTKATNSFPSGHTATAFMGAELVRIEYPWCYGLGAYTVASVTAFMRLYNDRHWANDILAGAGIGILSARMAYWMLPRYDKWFFSKNNKKTQGKSFSLIPFFDFPIHRAGIAAICVF